MRPLRATQTRFSAAGLPGLESGGMETTFEEMKRYVGFSAEDAGNLAAFRAVARPHLPWIAERFYQRILDHPGAHRVFTGPGWGGR